MEILNFVLAVISAVLRVFALKYLYDGFIVSVGAPEMPTSQFYGILIFAAMLFGKYKHRPDETPKAKTERELKENLFGLLSSVTGMAIGWICLHIH